MLFARGNISKAAKRLTVARQTLHRWVHRHPELRELIEEIAEGDLDSFEDVVRLAARRGSWRAAVQWLSTKGRSRGWGKLVVEDVDRVHELQAEVEDLRRQLLKQAIDDRLPGIIAEEERRKALARRLQ